MSQARIGIVEDDSIFRGHLTDLLSPSYQILAWSTAEQFIADPHALELDLVCVDLELPHMSGLDLLRWIAKNQDKRTPSLVISSLGSERQIVEAIEAGAMGYVFKSDDHSLLEAVSTVLAGGALVSSTIMMRLVQSFQARGKNSWRSRVSEREAQIVDLLMEGRSRAETASLLKTSEQTVKSQIASIYRKLQVSNRVELINKISHM